ncbi:hypothetical protein OQA88_13311 [Cercophora sp. LCS_1]
MATKLCRYFTTLAILLAPVFSAPAPEPQDNEATGGSSSGIEVDTYDYIVVGSGPGGAPVASNLAKAGHSVLLLEAGDDQSADVSTQILQLGLPQFTNRWDFYVRNYADDVQQLKNNHLTWRRADGSLWVGNGSAAPADATLLGVYYPRGATLGGSSVINAGVSVLPPGSDWDFIASLTGDQSWRANKMRQIFERIEKNLYLPPGTPGHGFNGYLKINGNDGSIWDNNPELVETLKPMVASVGDNPAQILPMFTRDLNNNSPNRDTTQGLFGLPFHVNQTWGRFSARNIILDTLNAKKPNGSPKYRLTLKTNSLATRVLFETKPNKKPRAIGIEYLQGQSLYGADPRSNPSATGTTRQAFARKEVILSAGVFNTPQLLLLSGIGPAADLATHNITALVNAPGVGKSLQDNQELPVVGLANAPYTTVPEPGDPQCTFGFPPDPCIAAFAQGTGPYARAGSNAHAFMLRTNHSTSDKVDILMFGIGNFAFRGYWPPEAVSNIPFDPPGTFGLSMVKINPQNRAGTVKLRSGNPRDTPVINFNLFAQGAATDVGAMADVVAWARGAYGNVAAPLGPLQTREPPCGGGSCRAGDEQWIREQAFGHHAVGTCAIGAASDADAVLDSKFRVRGVNGLRVVDGSAFPRVPGPFPVIATFLLGEKASGVILNDA